MASRGRTVALAVLALGIGVVLWRALGTDAERGGEAVQPMPAVAPAIADDDALPARELAVEKATLPVEPEPAPIVEAEIREPSPSPGAERTVVRARGKRREVVRGRVVHVRTGQGLPGLEIRIHPRGSEAVETVVTDDDGRFESTTRYGRQWLTLRASDPAAPAATRRTLRHRHRPPPDDSSPPCEVLWEFDGGLLVRLAITPGDAADGWQARVVETISGTEHEWKWLPLALDGSTGDFRLHYAKPEGDAVRVRPPGDRVRVDVTDERRLWRGSAPLETSVGIHPGVVDVEVELRAAAVEGRVTDESGEPVEARVIAIGRGAARPGESALNEAGTDGDGRYALNGLAPGSHRLLVASDHRPVTRFELDLAAGEVVTRDVVVATVSIAGDIEGALVGPPGDESPTALVRLEALEGATDMVELAGFDLGLFGKKPPTGRSPFAFRDLPEGTYRISLTPLDGRRYEPDALELSPPHDQAVFVTADAAAEDGRQELVLLVRDAETGERLNDFTLLARVDRYWATEVMDVGAGILDDAEDFPRMPLLLVVSAPGHRPTTVDLEAARTEDERITLEVDLEPGWGLALVIADADRLVGGSEATFEEDVLPAHGLAGVEVLVDGRPAGTSDADGLALLALDGPIEAGQLGLSGATILLVQPFRSHAATPDAVGFAYASRD